ELQTSVYGYARTYGSSTTHQGIKVELYGGIPVALAIGGNGFRSVLLPNPSQGVSALSLNQNVSGLEVVVTDLNGTQVYREAVPKDRLTVELDGSAYPGGVYLVSVYEKDRLLE